MTIFTLYTNIKLKPQQKKIGKIFFHPIYGDESVKNYGAIFVDKLMMIIDENCGKIVARIIGDGRQEPPGPHARVSAGVRRRVVRC